MKHLKCSRCEIILLDKFMKEGPVPDKYLCPVCYIVYINNKKHTIRKEKKKTNKVKTGLYIIGSLIVVLTIIGLCFLK